MIAISIRHRTAADSMACRVVLFDQSEATSAVATMLRMSSVQKTPVRKLSLCQVSCPRRLLRRTLRREPRCAQTIAARAAHAADSGGTVITDGGWIAEAGFLLGTEQTTPITTNDLSRATPWRCQPAKTVTAKPTSTPRTARILHKLPLQARSH